MNDKIQGWMRKQELDWLYEKSKVMESVVEIGSWKGKSTEALLMGCKGTVYAVDHFLGDPGSELQQEQVKKEDVYEIFMQNVGHFPNLKVLKMDSKTASEIVSEADMVFIDGDHSYQAVKEDIELWLPKAKKLICGHDYEESRVGLRKAVNELVGLVHVYNSIWFKELQ